MRNKFNINILRNNFNILCESKHLKKGDFCKLIGVSNAFRKDYFSIGPKMMKGITDNFPDITEEWLLTSHDAKEELTRINDQQIQFSIRENQRGYGLESQTSDSFSLVPKYKARLSGGSGSFETSAEIENFLSFKTTWLRARCPMNNCGLFEVIGDSMAPFITDGDVVLVDMKKNQTEDIIDGKIYAFSEGDRIRIKRLTLKGSSIVAYSDNKLEGGEPAPVESDFILIGKVVWVGHEVG